MLIDLGDELADYDDEPCKSTWKAKSYAETSDPRRPPKSKTVPLADLQKQGFNREPPPGYWPLTTDPGPVNMQEWFGDEDVPRVGDQPGEYNLTVNTDGTAHWVLNEPPPT